MNWFYFKVITKLPKDTVLKFNIINLLRSDSFYKNGLLPNVNSASKPNLGWHRDNACFDVTYAESDPELFIVHKPTQQQTNKHTSSKRRQKQVPQKPKQVFYTLSFKYKLAADNEIVSFATDRPYSYSMMIDHAKDLASKPDLSNFYSLSFFSQTLANVQVPLLTITDDVSTLLTYNDLVKFHADRTLAARTYIRNRAQKILTLQQNSSISKKQGQLMDICQKARVAFDQIYVDTYVRHNHKKGIIITARVHPGEPQGSFSVQGLINYLVSEEEGADQLRKSFVFYIVPMLNPDGVIYGNHRCSLLGVDLNRRWLQPSKVLHPVIYATKQLVKMVCEDREVPIYIDMHSHFRIKEPFMYCCNMLFDNIMFDSRSKNAFLRVLPLLLSQKNQIFSFKESSFRMEKFKESSARIVLFKEFGILNSVTLENAFLFKKKVEVEYESDEEDQATESLTEIEQTNIEKANQEAQQEQIVTELETYEEAQGLNRESSSNEDQVLEQDQVQTSPDNLQAEASPQPQALKKKKQIEQLYFTVSSDHIKMGEDLGKVLVKFIPNRPNQRRINFIVGKFLQVLHNQLIASMQLKRKNTQILELTKDQEQEQQVQVEIVNHTLTEGEGMEGSNKQRSSPSSPQDSPTKQLTPHKQQKQFQKRNFSFIDPQGTIEYDNQEQVQLNQEFTEIEEFILQQAREVRTQKILDDEVRDSSSDSEQEVMKIIKVKNKKKKKVQQKEKSPLKDKKQTNTTLEAKSPPIKYKKQQTIKKSTQQQKSNKDLLQQKQSVKMTKAQDHTRFKQQSLIVKLTESITLHNESKEDLDGYSPFADEPIYANKSRKESEQSNFFDSPEAFDYNVSDMNQDEGEMSHVNPPTVVIGNQRKSIVVNIMSKQPTNQGKASGTSSNPTSELVSKRQPYNSASKSRSKMQESLLMIKRISPRQNLVAEYGASIETFPHIKHNTDLLTKPPVLMAPLMVPIRQQQFQQLQLSYHQQQDDKRQISPDPVLKQKLQDSSQQPLKQNPHSAHKSKSQMKPHQNQNHQPQQNVNSQSPLQRNTKQNQSFRIRGLQNIIVSGSNSSGATRNSVKIPGTTDHQSYYQFPQKRTLNQIIGWQSLHQDQEIVVNFKHTPERKVKYLGDIPQKVINHTYNNNASMAQNESLHYYQNTNQQNVFLKDKNPNQSISSIHSDHQIDDLKSHIKQVVRQSRESLINMPDETIGERLMQLKNQMLKPEMVYKDNNYAKTSKKRGTTQASRQGNAESRKAHKNTLGQETVDKKQIVKGMIKDKTKMQKRIEKQLNEMEAFILKSDGATVIQ